MAFKNLQYNAMLTGGSGNRSACKQITSSDGTITFGGGFAYALTAVGADATFTILEEDGQTSDLASQTLYQNTIWPGEFTKIQVDTGTVIYYKYL